MPHARLRPLPFLPRLGLLAGLAAAGLAWGARGGAAAPEARTKHLAYVASYEQAMLEARLRGVPILFARHKDG